MDPVFSRGGYPEIRTFRDPCHMASPFDMKKTFMTSRCEARSMDASKPSVNFQKKLGLCKYFWIII